MSEKKVVTLFSKKTKKNQEIVNNEISSKTPLVQTSEKLTKLPLQTDLKQMKKLLKKSCAKFFDKFKNFYFFRVFLRKCLKNSSKGTRNN